ncbi:hypothetical protein AN963_24840 [Brevibacillus choshinensis]|uniref:Uncharacterized protein n=1 Tax=Brevibacillus choshinensis TaxID=54911 RepID=A0ABR5N280_BRECH|nr:hypothetical protein [Brevibacillus choshinensis]KQL44607.1 hypothetical protein AN963_24840 [Brevibacillus choshinensis]
MSKSSTGNIIGPFITLIVLMLLFGIVKGCNAVVQYFSEGSTEEQGQIVLEFEREMNSIEGSVEGLGDQVAEEVRKIADHKVPDLDKLKDAENKFHSVSERIKSLEIPSGLTEEREQKLKDIQTDMEQVYAFKSYAMMDARHFIINSDPKSLQDFVTNTSLAQDNLTNVVTDMVMLKKELGVLDVDVTQQKK